MIKMGHLVYLIISMACVL